MALRRVIRRVVSWPVFASLAVLHLAVLPLLLSEPDDDVLSVVAGLGYVMLAAIDYVLRRRDRAAVVRRRSRSIDGGPWW